MTTRQEFHEATVHLGFSYAMDYHDEEFNSVHTEKAYQAWCIATSRQEAKIKALRESLTWALSNISEEPYEWSCEEDSDAHTAAIALAKEPT